MIEAGPIRVVRIIGRLNVGGPSLHVVYLNKGLGERGFDSRLLSGREGEREGSMLDLATREGVAVRLVEFAGSEASLGAADLKTIVEIRRLVREFRPHIVHTHTAKAGFVGRIAAWSCRVPVIVHTFHGHVLEGYFSDAKSRLLRIMERSLALLSDKIVAVSDRVKSDLVRLRIAPERKIEVVNLGLDLRRFGEAARWRGGFRAEIGLDPRAPLVGIVGRIVPIKNHALFLEAAARLATVQPEVHFVVVGDGALLEECSRRARALGIGDRVTFTGLRDDLERIYSDLDALLITSDNEGTPVSAIEAMAAGVPVVATRVGGLPDLIEDGVSGSLVPPRDPQALADATHRVLQAGDNLHELKRAARDRSAHFSTERLCDDMERLYRSLLNG